MNSTLSTQQVTQINIISMVECQDKKGEGGSKQNTKYFHYFLVKQNIELPRFPTFTLLFNHLLCTSFFLRKLHLTGY
jgi:hypothetical protein